MNRKIYWLILFNPAFLALYGYGLSVVAAFCAYGNVEKRLPRIAAIFLAGLAWFLIWTVVYFILKKKMARKETAKKVFWMLAAEIAALLVITGYYGQKIYGAAQPYSGKLGSYLSDRETKKEFSLEDSRRDFMENGLDGIIGALSEHCGLDADWDLYTANTLTLGVDGAGTIQSLDAFLYAFDEAGTYHSWLISYDFAKSGDMTVYLDGYADTTYRAQEQMKPLFTMIDALRQSDLRDSIFKNGNILKYSGYTAGSYDADAQGSWYVVTETENGYLLKNYTAPLYGVKDEGFLLSIYRGDSKTATIATGIGSMETVSAIQERAAEEAETENAKNQGKTLVSNENGMTFYLDETTSMSLIVTDAAAGSRAYAFRNGDIYNESPFGNHIGVAESIYFLDESVGFVLLTDAAGDWSEMYYTNDGGATFAQTILPVSDGEEDLAGNEFGYTPEDMDYINTPYEKDGCLYVTVSYDGSGEGYLALRFRSEDMGQTWEYESDSDAQNPSAKKSVDELAKEVIIGKWGNGKERKQRLAAAGYDYDVVQKKENELLK